uniref:Putative exodeoxyribonuclease 8 PDDEXK-like domain-containing protein n=1 Tax=viral metagenome TaxID=1070528 RepID=A0A6M3LLV5_9ZZZZ
MDQGIYRIPADEYHDMEGASKSFLHTLLVESPAHAMTPREETQALYDGQAIHYMIFEPLRYEQKYVAKPEGMKFTTKDGIAWRDNHNHLKIIEYEKDQDFRAMAKAIRAHLAAHEDPVIQSLLSDGEPELSALWKDPSTGVDCRARFDWLNQKSRIITDLKSCLVARSNKFTNDAYTYGYDMQAAWYLYGLTQITGVEHKAFYFIACEKEPPYGVIVYKASEEMILHGLLRCSRAMGIYKECLESGNWPCYLAEVQELGLPEYVTRQNQGIIE